MVSGGGAGAGDDDDPSWHEEWMVPASKEQGAVRLLVVTDQDQLGRSSFARVTRAKSAFDMHVHAKGTIINLAPWTDTFTYTFTPGLIDSWHACGTQTD